MLQHLIETIIENSIQAIGWCVLKVVTFGRYRGFESEDMLREGAAGLATLAILGGTIYRWG